MFCTQQRVMVSTVHYSNAASIWGSAERPRRRTSDFTQSHSPLWLSGALPITWRRWHRDDSSSDVSINKEVEFGKSPLQIRRFGRSPFKTSALPLDRKGLKDGGDPEGKKELDSEPWLGAILFKRSAVKNHYDFQTSLERLGLGFLSTESSKTLANSMGLQSASNLAAEDTSSSTPVNVSIDISRDDDTRDLHLGGIARTTITLCCNRCLSPVVERIFASFNLLLTEKPVVEPTRPRLGVVLGETGAANDGPDVLDLELDDKLYFPREAKEIDLSKYVRDSVHLEIPFKSLCSVQCAGLCLTCGVNFNHRTCNCKTADVRPTWGPLEQLRKQLKDEEGVQ